MIDQEISREKPKKIRVKRAGSKYGNWGIGICVLTLLLAVMCAFRRPQFITNGIYGLFGIYTFAVLFLLFFAGISMKLSRKYSVNLRYILCSAGMLCALFTALHLVITRGQLAEMTFGEYLKYGFSDITPGGAVFAVPSFVLWNLFDGLVGSSIILGCVVIVCAAFIMALIISKHGVNKVIKKKQTAGEIKIEGNLEYSGSERELSEKVEQQYQELLQKQGRTKLDKKKSELGLTAPPSRPISSQPIYDTAVPMDRLAPQGAAFVGDEINRMSTDAANRFAQGLQQPMYQPQPVKPPMFSSAPMPHPPMPPPSMWTPPGASPVFTGAPLPFNSQDSDYDDDDDDDDDDDEEVYIPTTRARSKVPAAAPGQTRLDSVMAETKPVKTYKPRRYVRPLIDLIRTESTNLNDYHADAVVKQGMLDAKLKEFGVNAKVTGFTVAPAITRFEVQLGLGTRANDVYRLDPDFQYVLGTTDIRLENVPGKNAIGIEVPNRNVGCVSIKDILASKEWANNKNPLAVAVGKNLNDEIVIGDIGSMPHLLIAGSTGSGKSVCINTLLTSLVYRAHPDDVKLLLVDMKLVELNMYNEIPHMLIPRSIGDVFQAINALKWMQTEMQRRYKILEACRFNHISQYHAQQSYQNGQLERMPYIIMVIDEAADLIHNGKKDVEDAIKRLSALARACGIHIVLATQRPSVDVITAVIKTNFPVRIGFKVNSRGDSTTIINETGCEKLVGRGDMLFSKEGKIQRVQGAYIEVEEARRVMNFIRENNARDFDSELEDLILNGPPPENAAVGFGDGPAAARNQDPLYLPVLRWLVRDENLNRTASISGIQRQFGLGFGRAGKIIDQLAAAGYVSAGNGVKVREVLIFKDEVDNLFGAE